MEEEERQNEVERKGSIQFADHDGIEAAMKEKYKDGRSQCVWTIEVTILLMPIYYI